MILDDLGVLYIICGHIFVNLGLLIAAAGKQTRTGNWQIKLLK